MYDAGDTLVSIARQYGVSLPEVIRWNAIEDGERSSPVRGLIVQPGNPDEPTGPEKALAKRQPRNDDATRTRCSNPRLVKRARQGHVDPRKVEGERSESDRMNFRKNPLETAPEPRKYLAELRYVDKSTFSSRIAKKIEPSALDIDATRRVRREKSDPNKIGRLTALGGRVAKAIIETIDPFGEVAERRKKAEQDKLAAQEKAEKDEAAAAAASHGKSEQTKLLTLEEKREGRERDVYPRGADLAGVVAGGGVGMAETESRKATWAESLTGRLTIPCGPVPSTTTRWSCCCIRSA